MLKIVFGLVWVSTYCNILTYLLHTAVVSIFGNFRFGANVGMHACDCGSRTFFIINLNFLR